MPCFFSIFSGMESQTGYKLLENLKLLHIKTTAPKPEAVAFISSLIFLPDHKCLIIPEIWICNL